MSRMILGSFALILAASAAGCCHSCLGGGGGCGPCAGGGGGGCAPCGGGYGVGYAQPGGFASAQPASFAAAPSYAPMTASVGQFQGFAPQAGCDCQQQQQPYVPGF